MSIESNYAARIQAQEQHHRDMGWLHSGDPDYDWNWKGGSDSNSSPQHGGADSVDDKGADK